MVGGTPSPEWHHSRDLNGPLNRGMSGNSLLNENGGILVIHFDYQFFVIFRENGELNGVDCGRMQSVFRPNCTPLYGFVMPFLAFLFAKHMTSLWNY